MLEMKSDQLIINLIRLYKIPVVQLLPLKSYEDISRTIAPIENFEGVVVAFEDGHRLKLKGEWYCRLHKAKERITEERHVVTDILNGDIDDVLAQQTDEDRERLEGYVRRFWKAVDIFVQQMAVDVITARCDYSDRKSYALAKTADRNHMVERAVFHFWDSRDIKDKMRSYVTENIIKPNCGSRIKFTTMKQKVFKDVSFKY